MGTARALAAHIHDKLANDPCLAGLLDQLMTVTHGGADPCGQPFESHTLPAIRRDQQPWPADWCTAVVTFGQFSRSQSPFPANSRDRNRESWTFVVGIFVRSTVNENGEELAGDTWALDIYDQVIRILGNGPRREDRLPCGGDLLVARMDQEGDIMPIQFVERLRAWVIKTRFRWATIGRGIMPIAEDCDPCPPAVSSGGGGGNGNGNEQTAFLLRHFNRIQALQAIDDGWNPGEYDGFVFGYRGVNNEETHVVESLMAQGKRAFAYYDIMVFPPHTDFGYVDPWWTFWRTFQASKGLVNPLGQAAFFKLNDDCLQRQFVDWSLITAGERQTIADMMFQLIPTGCGLFLDQAWLREAPYFFFCAPSAYDPQGSPNFPTGGCGTICTDEGGGPFLVGSYPWDIPAGGVQNGIRRLQSDGDFPKWVAYQDSILAFYQLVDTMAAARGTWVLKNGSHRVERGQIVPRPIYYENANANPQDDDVPSYIANAINGWREHPRNVLSTKQEPADPTSRAQMFAAWEETGGWIACTYTTSEQAQGVTDFYALAAQERASWVP